MTTSINSRLGTAPEEGCKAPVKTVANNPITLSGEQTINSVAVVDGDRVLVNGQVDPAENGIYNVRTTAWTYATDWNTSNDVIAGMLVPSSETIELYQLQSFTGEYIAGVTEISFQIGAIASPQVEEQLGSQAVSRVFTFNSLTYNPSVQGDLEVVANGQELYVGVDYEETSPTSITLLYDPIDTSRYKFKSNQAVTLTTTTSSSVTHTSGGIVHNLATYLNYGPFNVKHYGAIGDGVTDDSTTIQAAIDAARSAFLATEIPQTVWFPSGYTYLMKLVTNKPGVNLLSDGAVLLKTPAGAETDENVLKWWRMITHSQSDFATDLDLSHRIRISGFVFDGNLANMNWTDNTYNQEQAHCLFLIGNSAPTAADRRAKFQVDNVHFQNSVADGLSQYYNTDLIVRNITANNCFRGGFTSTGGNSKVNIDGYIGENARFDIEVDGVGYGGSYRLDSVVNNIEIDLDGGGTRPGGMDIGYADGGTFIGDNIQVHTSPANFLGKRAGLAGKRFLITNSKFTTGEFSATGNRFIKPINAKFIDTEFYCSLDNALATDFDGLQVTYSLNGEDVNDEEINFVRCKFDADPAIFSTLAIMPRAGVYSATNIQANGNKIRFTDCTITDEFDYGTYLGQGGYIRWDGGHMNAATAFWCDYSGSIRFFTLNVGKIEGDYTTYLKTNTAISATGNTIIHRDTEIDEAKNVFDAGGTKDFANVKGRRLIRGAASPVGAQPCWNGDRYVLNTLVTGSPTEWVATNTAWSATGTWSSAGNLV